MAYPDLSRGQATRASVSHEADCAHGGSRLGARLGSLTLLGIIALVGCNGPNQKAGSERDKAAAAAQGEPYKGNGPNERIGQAQDRAADAEQNVRDADADALKAQGKSIKRQADVAAAPFDEKSRSIREAADQRAKALDERAKATRK
jgi:hypothetical protein